MSYENEGNLVIRMARPIPQTKPRALSIGLGLGRIALAVGTIPLSIESVKQGNFAGDKKYITFYWTEALMILTGVLGVLAGISVSTIVAALHSRSTLLIGFLVPMIYMIAGGLGCKYDGIGVNPTPGTFTHKGNNYIEYAGNDADPKYTYILIGIGVAQFSLSMAAYCHQKTWKMQPRGKHKRREPPELSPTELEQRQEEQIPFTYIPESRPNFPQTIHPSTPVQSRPSIDTHRHRSERGPTPASIGDNQPAPSMTGATCDSDHSPPSYESVVNKGII